MSEGEPQRVRAVWDFNDISRQHENIRRKILRCKESGDMKRLLGLRDQLERVRQNIDEIKPSSLRRPIETTEDGDKVIVARLVFRRSYAFEAFIDSLLTGRGEVSRPAAPHRILTEMKME